MDEADIDPRIEQLYLLLQPHAAGARALLDEWDRDNPFEALATETVAPDEFVSLMQRISELPVSEVVALLDEAIAADKGNGDLPDPDRITEVISKLEAQARSVGENIDAFAKARVPLPAALPSEIVKLVRAEEAKLERDLAAARARMITEHDLRILRDASAPSETIAAIVRDAPSQEHIDQLTSQLRELRRVLAVSADAAKLDEQLGRLEVFTNAAHELLGPILDPMFVQQLRDFAQPLLKADDGRPRGG